MTDPRNQGHTRPMGTTGSVPPPPAASYKTDGHFIFTSGQVGVDAQWRPIDGPVAEEIRQTLRNLWTTLRSAGCDLKDVLHVRTYLSDMDDFEEFNNVWSEFFPEDPPARTTIQAGLHPPFKVECEAVALFSPHSDDQGRRL